MAECPEGLYGYNCDKQCSENCGDPNKCNRMTGQCKGGCQAGWTEGRCEKGECLSLLTLTCIPDIKVTLH